MLGEGVIASDELLSKSLLWVIAADARCSQLFVDADAAGLLVWALRPARIQELQE